MAVRPLVTTGVALLSAGALVAGTPALFVPRDEITVASSAIEAPAQQTLTAEQINLVALSLQGALGAFGDGYGGYYYQGYVPVPTAGYVVVDGKLVDPKAETPAGTELFDANGKALYVEKDGHLVRATVGDMGEKVQFYDAAGNKSLENVYDPGNCSATGAACHDGFTGLAYYLSDNILPVGDLDNIFFEGGTTAFAYLGSVIAAAVVDGFDPTGRLQLSKRVDEFFAGGAAYVVYSVINDNLPDTAVGKWVKGLNGTFYTDGITGVVKYVVETVQALTAPPEEEKANTFSLLSAQDETEATTKTETESGVSSTTLPNVSKLLSLPTNFESPFKKLVEQLEAPAEPKLVKAVDLKEETTVDDTVVEGATDPVTPAVEVPKPDAPKFELPKLPKLDLGLDLTPSTTVKEVKDVKETAAQEESEAQSGKTESADAGKTESADAGSTKSADTGSAGVASKSPNKFAPKSRTTERKKSAGEKFVENATKNLEKAFKPTTKAGAGKQETAKSDTGSDSSGAKAGNTDTKDNKGTKDNKD
ncbi:hypothetical protein [Mycobacterium sp. NPDC004974]